MLTGIAIAVVAFSLGAYHQDKMSRRVKIIDGNGGSIECHPNDVEKVAKHYAALQDVTKQ